MRDYVVMRGVLAAVAKASSELSYSDLWTAVCQDDQVLKDELVRLERDGLIDADVFFGKRPFEQSRCRVHGLTDEGREFYKLIENDKAWEIILHTLKAAGIDISYPLLKEVCEEIVKRYVTSCIPEITRKK